MATKTQIYKEVLREYDALRTRKAAELRERKESLYARFPRLAEIEETLSMVGVSTAKLVLLHPEEREKAMTEMKQKQQVLQDERMALLAKNCLSPSLLKLEYACEKCRDTGYIEGTPCTCMRRRLMDRLYDQSNVRDEIKQENFDTFDLRLFDTEVVPAEGISPKENAQRNLKKAMEFAEHPEGENLLLYGGAGRGKTFLCNCIAKEVLEHGKTVLYLTAGQLFKQLEDMRFRSKEEEEPFDWDSEILDADLLIIDDLGIERSTEFALEQVFNVIDSRYRSKLPLIVTTNMTLEELKNPQDLTRSRIYDRVLERCVPLRINNQNIRQRNAAESMKEARKILESGTGT